MNGHAFKEEDIRKTKDQPVLRRLLYLTGPYRPYLIAALLSALISVTLQLLAPVLIGRAIDYVLGAG